MLSRVVRLLLVNLALPTSSNARRIELGQLDSTVFESFLPRGPPSDALSMPETP